MYYRATECMCGQVTRHALFSSDCDAVQAEVNLV